MENYELKENEVVLYKGEVSLINPKHSARLLLTNLNVVFIIRTSFFKEDITTEIFSVSDVKTYEGEPQVKVSSDTVEIYFKNTEKEFKFHSKSDQRKFISEITKLLTGKSGTERTVEKIKKNIDVINDTLGCDIIKSTENIAKNGIMGSTESLLGKIGNLFGKNKK